MVSIIILNYNGKKYLKDCLEAVLNQSYREFELIFFDNNSDDSSVSYVEQNFNDPRLKIVKSEKNLGFAGGNNEALKHTGNDIVVLLNNDTVVDKDWLLKLVETTKEPGIVASSFVKTEGINPKYYESNGSVSYAMYNVMNAFSNIEDEFYPNGCSLIFRKSEIGEPFDSDYFYYGEDVYLGLKARFMGLRIKFVKDSKVFHYGSGGSYSKSARRSFYQSRNQILNLYSFFSPVFIFKVLPIVAVVRTFRTFAAIFSSDHSFWGLYAVPFWLLANSGLVLRKISAARKFKRVPEEEVIRYMSSRVMNGYGAFSRFINSISYAYSRLMGIKPYEYYNRT